MRGILRAAMACALVFPGIEAAAEGREWLGWGHVFNNDGIGDGQDRWRSGSYQVSVLRGPEWQGSLPQRPGALWEFRTRGEIIAPSNLARPVVRNDRRYVGILSGGLHTHFQHFGIETSLGADLVVVGPQTGVDEFHDFLHDIVGATDPKATRTQIGNNFYPTALIELGREYFVAGRQNLRLRPFLEAQAGAETFVRIGGDLTFGRLGLGGLRLRDPVSGQRIMGIHGDDGAGLSLLLGGDIAYVEASEFLESRPGFSLDETRERLRAGLFLDWGAGGVFYGLTWLGKEFEQQDEGQLIGSLSLHLNF